MAGLLVDREVRQPEPKRFEARMRSARLRHVGACPEMSNYRAAARLRQGAVPGLLTGRLDQPTSAAA